MERRLLLAVTLSIIVMLVYPFILAKINPSPPDAPSISTQPIESQEVIGKQYKIKEPETIRASLPPDAKYRVIVTDRYELTLSNIGGSVQKIRIKDTKRADIDLVDNAIYDAGLLSIEGKGALSGLSSRPFEIKEETSTASIVRNGLRVEKNIKFLKDKCGLQAFINITNLSASKQPLSFEITTGSSISNNEMYESRFIGADVLYKDGRLKRLASGNFKNDNRLYNNNIEWLALRNKYYSIIAKPLFSPKGVFTNTKNARPATGFIVDEEEILPNETKTYRFLLYIGPTDISELETVDSSFSKALNFGIFTSISLVLLSVLKFFYALVHNYGIAILLLTCCISLLLFPLSLKSMKSMRKLQELQPHIEKVRLEHKDNPQKLNKEIMELYRRYNVNPMGGCMPMFLQMPIFIALYQTLARSVELKGADFLWIKDLSMPDAAFRLPATVPLLGNTINLLPILMIGAMIFQQKLSQFKVSAQVQTDQQKMMGIMMPLVFGFIFYSLPSGLVLYWLISTVLTSSMQFFILKKA